MKAADKLKHGPVNTVQGAPSQQPQAQAALNSQ